MWNKFKRFFIGSPLKNEELGEQKMNVLWGLPILSSDAISSVAYAGEEILWVLIPVLGLLSYKYMLFTSIAIVGLMVLLVLSYRQTIDHYPNGGGAYIVAKENLGTNAGLIAGASLIVDYILTVAVSASASTAAITSMIPQLSYYKIEMSIAIIIILTVVNLRGVRESSRIFGLPTYVFLVSVIFMIGYGLFKVFVLGFTPESVAIVPEVAGDITLFLILRAFAAGCTALTGVEAVSNSVPNFKEPAQKKSKLILVLLALIVFALFGGTSYLATLYHAVPNVNSTVISQIAFQVFDGNIFYYVIQIATMVILAMAANTAFNGFPLLMALIAQDGYVPKQFSKRGDRLGFSNGVKMLSFAAAILIILFRGQTHALLPLYAVGVFVSFTLSQSGMFLKVWRDNKKGKYHQLFVNGLGASVTFVTSIVIAVSKFYHGAWIVLIVVPVLVYLMKNSREHYTDLAAQLKLSPEEVEAESELIDVKKYAIVLIDTLNKASLKAINYATDVFTPNYVIAFHVSTTEEDEEKIRLKWAECNIMIPLVVEYSPYREVVAPLMRYFESAESESKPGDILTIVMPEFVFENNWKNMYHHQTASAIRKRLLTDRHISVIVVPYVVD